MALVLQFEPSDYLPQTVCNGCAEKLVEFHLFRTLLLESRENLLANWSLESITEIEDAVELNDNADDECYDKIVILDLNEDNTDDLHAETGTTSRLQCDSCSATLSSKASLKKHQKNVHKHLAKKPINDNEQADRLICEKCERSFSSPSAFLGHYRQVHLNHLFGSKFKCPLCPRVFSGGGGQFLLILSIYDIRLIHWFFFCIQQ